VEHDYWTNKKLGINTDLKKLKKHQEFTSNQTAEFASFRKSGKIVQKIAKFSFEKSKGILPARQLQSVQIKLGKFGPELKPKFKAKTNDGNQLSEHKC
jgi:hypothetical protein